MEMANKAMAFLFVDTKDNNRIRVDRSTYINIEGKVIFKIATVKSKQ